MKNKCMFPTSLVLMSLISLMAVFFGCEDEPSMSNIDQFFEDNAYISDPRTDPTDSGLIISPTEAVALNIGQQILFSVTGGEGPMTWNVTAAAGTITAQQMDVDAIYTVAALAENNVIVSDRNGRAAIANIALESSASLSITPSTASVQINFAGETVNFLAAGGTPPYTWSLAFNDIGTITPAGDTRSAVYTTLANPIPRAGNTVQLRDSADKVVTATISNSL